MVRLVMLRLVESYFRHRWLYLLPIVLALLVAGARLYLAEPAYIASGTLYLKKESLLGSLTDVNNSDFSFQTAAAITAEQLRELLQTDSFVRAIVQSTSLESEMGRGPDAVEDVLSEARNSVWAYASGSNQLVVAATNEDRQVAYQLANAVIDSYRQWLVNASRQESESAVQFFEKLIVEYREDVEIARDEQRVFLEAHPKPLRGERPGAEQIDLDRLQAAVELAEARYASALDKHEQAELALALAESDIHQTYSLLDAPRIPRNAETSIRETAIEVALVVSVGLILSVAGVVGAALLDRTFRFPLDVQQHLELPVLGMVPWAQHPEIAKLSTLEARPAPTTRRRWRRVLRSTGERAHLEPVDPEVIGQ